MLLNARKFIDWLIPDRKVADETFAAIGSPLAATIPDSWKATKAPSFEDFNGNPDDYATPKPDPTPRAAVHLTLDSNEMKDSDVLAALSTLRAQSETRLAPDRVRIVQHGHNMSQIRKKNNPPILATGSFDGEDLLKLMK